MDESESLQINSEEQQEQQEQENGEEFYEKIEAPKFVDLTAPDPYHPGDDRYWFCTRVGCDQNHEEEMDSETIYKNFLLRVMAARSPNIRLQKALYRKDSGTDLKCPQTVPAKPSKPRVSRLALISSISKKIVDPKLKFKPLSKQNGTPSAKEMPSVTAKALTTPRPKKQLSNPDAFRSVRNPKTTAIAVPKNRVVAKALVFHSPKKSVRTKSSLELNTPVKTLCAGMKKLEITRVKKQVLGYNRPLPSDVSRKQLRGREVKSRVFDGLCSQNHKVRKAKSSKNFKNNNKEGTLKPMPCERVQDDCSKMEIEGKTRNNSQEVCSTSKTDEENVNEDAITTIEVSKPSLDDNKIEALLDTSRSNLSSGDDEDVPKFQAPVEIMKKDDKRHTSTSDDKENGNEVMESDDKENASASDDNRKLDLKNSNMEHKVLGKHETPKDSQKNTKANSNQSKEKSATVATAAQGPKHKKPKPTNPKPFRLRTYERRILKEENQEKKTYLAPLGEITPTQRGGNSQKKYQNTIERNDKCLNETENHNDTYESSENETNNKAHKSRQLQNGNLGLKISKERVGRKISTTPQRHTISSQQKLVTSQQECGKDKSKSTPKLGKTLKRTKSPSMTQSARPQEAAPIRKDIISIMTAGQLGTIKETSPTILKANEAPKLGETSASPVIRNITSVSPASRPSLQGKRIITIPKEPNFHSIHMPKSCTRRVA